MGGIIGLPAVRGHLGAGVRSVITAGYVDRDVNVRGLKLHYQEWGAPDAPVILMIHGFGVSGHMFDEFAERLQGSYRLLALDQRGHGDSDWSDEGDYSRDAFVEDIEAFCAALNLERFVLMGHSMGGLNSVAFVNRYPARARSLVLVDVGPESAREGVDNIVRFTRGPDELEFDQFVEMAHRFNQRRTIENIRERMRHRLRQMPGGKWTWKFDSRFRQQDANLRIGSEMSNDEVWALFRGVMVPTLLLRGAESDVLTQEVAERAAQEMARCRLVVVPAAGHSVPGDNPDDFTAAVTAFLDDVANGTFAPGAVAEPPPLERLVEVHEEAQRRRRGPSTLAMLAGGAAGLLAVAGLAFIGREAARKRRRKQAEAKASRPLVGHREVTIPAVDVEVARERALALLNDLSHVSREGLSRARIALHDVDVERAREGAEDVLAALGERTRHAPAAVRVAVQKADARTAKLRSKPRKSGLRRSAGMAWKVATVAPMLLGAAKKVSTAKQHANGEGMSSKGRRKWRS